MKDRSPDIRYFESFLRRCLYEAKDFRNDGWVKSHYENEIKLAAELANEALNKISQNPHMIEEGMDEE